MIVLTHDKADNFVEKQQRLGNDVWWDGWDMVFFSPNPKAVYVPNSKDASNPQIIRGAAFRNGSYGYLTRVSVGSDGKWRVPNRNAKHLRRSRTR